MLPGRDVKKGNILNGTIFCKFTGLQSSDIRWIKTLAVDHQSASRGSKTRTYINAIGKPNIFVRQNTKRIQIAVEVEIQNLHSEAATSCGNAGRCD
jgi:hypothetical protein